MSGVERQEPGGTDPIDLHFPRRAAGSGRVPTTEQKAPQSMPPVTRLIDTKSLLQVTPYHGDKASFLGWKWSFLISVRAISKPLYEGFKKIEDDMNQDFRKSRFSIKDLELSDQAYTLLALLCKDEACAYVRSAEDGNGYQAWRALLRARTARNATNLLNQSLEPTFMSPYPRVDLRQWNKNAEEYATRTGERVSDGIRRAVYMNKIAPQDMRQHLMLNQSRLSTAKEVAQEIEDYWDATEEFSLDEKGQARFVAPVGIGLVRQGKGGKHGGKSKGKGKIHKGPGFQPERGEQRRFGGYCNWCWRTGHKEAHCWFKQEYTKSNPPQDALQRDIREWSNSAEKGQGHSQPKGKGKGRGKGKRRHSGKGNHNQDQAGSPDDETGQRRLDDFGLTRQRVEFVGDVQEHTDDFETPRMDRAAYVFYVQKRKSVMTDWTELPSSSKRVFSGVHGREEPAGSHDTKIDQSTGALFFAVGCRDDRPIVDSGSVVSTCRVD